MGVSTMGSARISSVFQPPAVPRLTEAALTAAGLPTEPFTTMHVELVRSSPKGKWHAPGSDTHRCTHVTRVFGYRPTSLPVQKVSVLGEHDLCSSCAHQVRLPGPAGVLHVAAGLIVAAAQWVTELERLAPGMGWLEVARWSWQTPFGPPDPVPDLLTGLNRARGFTRHRAAARTAWERLRQRADTAIAVARQAAGPPGLRVLAARARDLLLRDQDTLNEAHILEAIGGGARRMFYEPDLSRLALDAWLVAVAADGDVNAGHAAMLAAVEGRLSTAEVRDVSLLPRCWKCWGSDAGGRDVDYPATRPAPNGHDDLMVAARRSVAVAVWWRMLLAMRGTIPLNQIRWGRSRVASAGYAVGR